MTLSVLLSITSFVAAITGSLVSAIRHGQIHLVISILVGAFVGYVFSTIIFRSTTYLHGKFGIDSHKPSRSQYIWGCLWQVVIGFPWIVLAAFAGFGLMHLVTHCFFKT